MSGPYRARQVARMAGVTIKALRYYERIGLLQPARTEAGYRTYSADDLRTLEHIRALRALRFPLARMRHLLAADGAAVLERIRAHQRHLTEERDRIAVALAAVERAERDDRLQAAPGDALRHALVVEEEKAAMRRYFSDAAWAQWEAYYDDWPAPPWRGLYREVLAHLDEDGGATRAQARLARCVELWHEALGPDQDVARQIRSGLARAWSDREHWPASLRKRFEEYRIVDVAAFFGRASTAAFRETGVTFVARGAP